MIHKVFAGVVVDDLPAARTWYESVLGRPADAAPMAGLFEWDLAPSARLQLVDVQTVREVLHRSDWGAAGSSSIAFVVDDLDRQVSSLESHGIPIGPRYATPGFAKTATLTDPAGNIVTFVEELGDSREPHR